MPKITLRNACLGLTACIMAASISLPAQAQRLIVDRCNVKQDGAYKPILTARYGAQDYTFKIGENGLTSGTAHSKSRAIAYVRAAIGQPDARATYTVCGDANYMMDFIR